MATNSLEPSCRRIPPNENFNHHPEFVRGAVRDFVSPVRANESGERQVWPFRRFNRSVVSVVGEHVHTDLDGCAGPTLKSASSHSLGKRKIQCESSDRRRVYRAELQRSEHWLPSAGRAECLYSRLPG